MKTEQITDFRSRHLVVTEPLTKEELQKITRKDGTIQVKVLHDFNYIVEDSKEGIAGDIAVKLTRNAEGLHNVQLELVGRKNDNAILKVTATPVL